MQIQILGCSGGVGPGLRTTTLLLDGRVLIDAGTGVGDLSLDAMRGLEQVLLTHSHLDHVCGLAFLADNLFGLREQPLLVRALPETIAVLRAHLFNDRLWPDFERLTCERGVPVLRFEPLEPAVALPLFGGQLEARAFRVDHSVPAVGYALRGPTRTVAFSGDTGGGPLLWSALDALPVLDDLLVEIAFADEDAVLGRIARHFTPAVLGQELARLRHRPGLHITHLKPGAEAAIEAECAEALRGHAYRFARRGDLIQL